MFGKKSAGIDLAIFVGSLTRALCESQQALASTRLKQILKHFTRNHDGRLEPNDETFAINDEQQVTIPDYVMSRVNNLGIDEVTVSCAASIVCLDKASLQGENIDSDSHVKYVVKPAGSADNRTFELTMKFSKKDDCEAEHLLAQFLNETINVYDKDDGDKKE